MSSQRQQLLIFDLIAFAFLGLIIKAVVYKSIRFLTAAMAVGYEFMDVTAQGAVLSLHNVLDVTR